MADLQAQVAKAVKAVDAAEAAKQKLVEERRAKREKLSRADFRQYNTDTHKAQIDAQAAVDTAQDELAALLNNARQELVVTAISETNKAGGK